VSGERESSLADPHGGPAATDFRKMFFYISRMNKTKNVVESSVWYLKAY
jgi:hypothetical protein